MAKLLLLIFLIITACNPVVSMGGFVHSLFTGNTTATMLGAGDMVLEQQTGKTAKEHVWDDLKKVFRETPKPRPKNIINKDNIEWEIQ